MSAQDLAEIRPEEFPGLEPCSTGGPDRWLPGGFLESIWSRPSRIGSTIASDTAASEAPSPETPANSVTELEGSGQTDVEVAISTGDDGHGADLPHTQLKG